MKIFQKHENVFSSKYPSTAGLASSNVEIPNQHEKLYLWGASELRRSIHKITRLLNIYKDIKIC